MTLDPVEARRRLGTAPVGRLATADAAGVPHAVPVVFVVDGDRLHIAVDHKPKRGTDLRRLRNIRENPRVALLVDHYDDDWTRLWWARADGTAAVVDDTAAMRGPIDALVAKYPQYRDARPDGPVITITVERVSGWSYR